MSAESLPKIVQNIDLNPKNNPLAPWNDKLIVTLLNPDARIPEKGTAQSAGYDLYASEPITIPAGETAAVPTKVSIGLPSGTYGRIAPRSGLALNHSIMVNGGVIDRDYTGEIKVILHNLSKNNYNIKHGDRIAQLILEVYRDVPILQMNKEQYDRLKRIGTRGDKGFGSTG